LGDSDRNAQAWIANPPAAVLHNPDAPKPSPIKPTCSPHLRSALTALASLALTLLGLLAITFVIGRVVPVDPALAVLGDRASEAQLARVREELGLNLPLPVQFARYVAKTVQGDLGLRC